MDRVPQACGSRALLPLRQLERRLESGGTRALDQRWVVTVVECSIPLTGGGQAWVYADALERARGRARWLAFIDIDEFLFSPACECLAPALRAYEPHPGVVVNWQVYGSSGLDAKPPGLVIESFVKRATTNWVRNRRVKSIVDPGRALRPRGPHFFEYEDGELAVTENHEPVLLVESRALARRLKQRLQRLPLVETDPYAIRHSSVNQVSVRRLRINHYAVKSRQEFAAKVGSQYFAYHDRNDTHDPILDRYVPRLRHRLQEIR
jgi:hypothetical protein